MGKRTLTKTNLWHCGQKALFFFQRCFFTSTSCFFFHVVEFLTYPGDTVRRRMIVNGMNGAERIYKNSIDCTLKIVRFEGVLGLWSGFTANGIRCVPAAAIQFFAYDQFKSMLIPSQD